MKNKTNWNDIPLAVWNIVYYKEDDNGNMKFYDFNGDCSNLCEGISKEDLKEMPKEKTNKLLKVA